MYKKKTEDAKPEKQVKCKKEDKRSVPGWINAAGTAELQGTNAGSAGRNQFTQNAAKIQNKARYRKIARGLAEPEPATGLELGLNVVCCYTPKPKPLYVIMYIYIFDNIYIFIYFIFLFNIYIYILFYIYYILYIYYI